MRSLRSRMVIGAAVVSLGAGLLTAAFIYWRLGGWMTVSAGTSVDDGSAQSVPLTAQGVGDGGPSLRQVRGSLLQEILPLVIGMTGVFLLLPIAASKWLLRPIHELNCRLAAIDAVQPRVDLDFPEVDKEIREVIKHFRQILSKLTDSLEDTREYAAEVAHELRTPLQIIRLKLETSQAKIDPILSEELQEEVHRLRHVVEQVLLVAKAGRGRLTLQNSRFDATQLTRDVIEDFQLLAMAEERTLELVAIPTLYIEADRKYFRQVLHALLTNALTHGEGEIRVKLREHRRKLRLFIGNKVKMGPGSNDLSLGLGLRVVKALLGTMPCTCFRRYAGPTIYGVLMDFSTVPPSSSVSKRPPVSGH